MGYFIHLNGETRGPYTIGQLRTMWNTGAVTADTLYCEDGGKEWLQLKVLADEFERPPEMPPIIPPPEKSMGLPVVPRRSNTGKIALVVVGLVILGGILVLWVLGSFVDTGASHDTGAPHE
jgi:hypothetical protein